MKATIESTDTLTILGGLNLRVWRGSTDEGTPFIALINRIEAREPGEQASIIKALQNSAKIDADDRAVLLRMGVINQPAAAAASAPPNSTPSTKA